VRALLPGRWDELLPVTAVDVRFEFDIDVGGRLCDNSCCREVMPEVLGWLPGRPFIVPGLRDGTFGVAER
jgi:hypothetical protein